MKKFSDKKRSSGPPKGPRKAAPPVRPQEPRGGPPYQTFEEARYLKALVTNKTPVRIVLHSGEKVEGTVEYYDTSFLRLTRENDANLFVFKSNIKYLEEEP